MSSTRPGTSQLIRQALLFALAAATLIPAHSAAQQSASAAQQSASAEAPIAVVTRDWRLVGEIFLRGDHVDRPQADEIERLQARLRLGVIWTATPQLELGMAVKGVAASHEIFPTHDNERRSTIALDRAFLLWLPTPENRVLVGKEALPLELTPMLWDADLRPLGVSWNRVTPMRDFDALFFTLGGFTAERRFEDPLYFTAAQAGWRIREGALVGGEVILSWLGFQEPAERIVGALVRTNRLGLGGELASDFRLLDLQVAGRLPLAGGSLSGRLDLAENLGAESASRGIRGQVLWHQGLGFSGLHGGIAAQRIQADAVLAALNSDDWWFHSASRGQSAWLGWRFPNGASIRGVGFRERRDGQEDYFYRTMLELRWEF